MGIRAFVARSGWNKTPITAQEWREAAALQSDLELHAGVGGEPVRAMLQGSRRRGVALQQGYLCAEHVNSRFIAVLFALAERLGAQVFSESRQPYRDVAEWQVRHADRVRIGGSRSRDSSRRLQTAPAARLAGNPAIAEPSWVPFVAGVMACLLVLWALN